MRLGIIVVVVLLLLAAAGFGVYYVWFHEPEAEQVTTSGEGVDIPVNEDAGVLDALAGGPEPVGGPDFNFAGDDAGSREMVAPVVAEVGGEESASTEEIVDLSPGATDVGESGVLGSPEEELPAFPEGTNAAPIVETTQPPRAERTPERITVEAEATATPQPPVVTGTPTPKPEPTTPPVATGNFSIKTMVPVLEAKLPAIRTAMKDIGVTLKEEKSGRAQRMQGYRVAIGYFRTKAEANSWAGNYLRPKGITYFVYPTRNMYSIQVGVYTQKQNVEKMVRTLYQKFPGWRLPVRTEPYTFTKSTYNLSLRQITETLGRKIQDTLFRMGVQVELAGA